MFGLFKNKQDKCIHAYHYLGEKNITTNCGGYVDIEEMHEIYCPICDSTRHFFNKNEALIEIRKYQLKLEYSVSAK